MVYPCVTSATSARRWRLLSLRSQGPVRVCRRACLWNPHHGLDDLIAAIEFIRPRLIVPMHYWTPSIRYDVGPIEDLLQRWSGPVIHIDDSSFEVSVNSMPSEPTIVTLQAKSDPLLRVKRM